MRSQTYLPIHSYQQTRKDGVSNLPAYTFLPTTLEPCSLKPTCPYTLTDNLRKMRSQTNLPHSYRQRRKVAVSNLTVYTLFPTNLERCRSTPVSNLLPQTLLFHLPTNSPERFRFTPVSNLPANTLTNKPGNMPFN